MVRYEVWVTTPEGVKLMLLDRVGLFEYGLVANDLGGFSMLLPSTMAPGYFAVDNRVEFWRGITGGPLERVMVGFIRGFGVVDLGDGLEAFVVSGPGVNDLLFRRIVAYAAGSAQASKTDYADDLMKAVVDENLGSGATDSDRDLETPGYVTIQADTSGGPSVEKSFSRRNVLLVLQDVAELARQQGTEIFFALEPNGVNFEFRTFVGQMGQDRTLTGTAPVFFGSQYGNMGGVSWESDAGEEWTVVYAGGQGEEADRLVVEVEDAGRSDLSVFNRREGWEDARQYTTVAGVSGAARKALEERRPRWRVGGQLLDGPQARFGRDWRFGDRVTVESRGQQLDGLIRMIHVAVDELGAETITARFETETALA